MKFCKQYIFTFVLAFAGLISYGQNGCEGCLIAFVEEKSERELWGYKSSNGQVIIAPQYEATLTDTLQTIAIVNLNNEWIVINRENQKILTPLVIDNGPDYVQEGLFRFLEDNKIGFADTNGKKIIPAIFDYALSFNNGLAAINWGGKIESSKGEYSSIQGGLWGYIDKNGQTVIEAKYAFATDYNGSFCEVRTLDDEQLFLDKNGMAIVLKVE